MDEEALRTEYWEDTRTHRAFPLWVVFREVGQAPGGPPYLRRTGEALPDILKKVEELAAIPLLAEQVGIEAQELRAILWYLTWVSERLPAPEAWEAWNRRVDLAWQDHTLQPLEKGG